MHITNLTLSVFTFFTGAPLGVFDSSPLLFLFPFEDFEVDGVPRPATEVVDLRGLLLSTGSSFGASFLGASTGDISSSV